MANKVIGLRAEPVGIVFLNGHVVNPHIKYMCLYSYICAAPNISQIGFLLN